MYYSLSTVINLPFLNIIAIVIVDNICWLLLYS